MLHGLLLILAMVSGAPAQDDEPLLPFDPAADAEPPADDIQDPVPPQDEAPPGDPVPPAEEVPPSSPAPVFEPVPPPPAPIVPQDQPVAEDEDEEEEEEEEEEKEDDDENEEEALEEEREPAAPKGKREFKRWPVFVGAGTTAAGACLSGVAPALCAFLNPWVCCFCSLAGCPLECGLPCASFCVGCPGAALCGGQFTTAGSVAGGAIELLAGNRGVWTGLRMALPPLVGLAVMLLSGVVSAVGVSAALIGVFLLIELIPELNQALPILGGLAIVGVALYGIGAIIAAAATGGTYLALMLPQRND